MPSQLNIQVKMEENGMQLVEMKDDYENETALEDGSNLHGSFKLIKDITTGIYSSRLICNNRKSFGVQFEI